MMGRYNIVEMLVSRGVRINATNMGDDTALHLAAAHNHRDIAFLVCSFAKMWLLSDSKKLSKKFK